MKQSQSKSATILSMRLTKFVHSCVLVETGEQNVLFDPGIFSWNSGLIDVSTLPKLDAVVVSHRHPDHCGEPFIKALVQQFPDVSWFAPADAHALLKQYGAQNVTNQSSNSLSVEEIDHAPVKPFAQQVRNLVSHWNNLVTHPGDTHDFSETKDVLLLPVQAPWGTTIKATQLALDLKPKYILPIHDWMWNDDWRQVCYDRFQQLFTEAGITFLRPVDGQPIEVEL